jgi:hypothetical protein
VANNMERASHLDDPTQARIYAAEVRVKSWGQGGGLLAVSCGVY